MMKMSDRELVNAWRKRLEGRKDSEVVFFLGRRKITKRDLLWNIENNTALGRKLKEMAYSLTISLLEKGKAPTE
jgi:hypothetical protein